MTHRTLHRRPPRALVSTALTLAVLALGACSVDRPAPIACNVDGYLIPLDTQPGPQVAVQMTGEPPISPYESVLLDSLRRALAPSPTTAERADPVEAKTLALSGGGPWGAYGTGFLKGWNEESDRFPRFAAVTGVSTGALQAPFAFLGGEYLDRLDYLYRTATNETIFAKRNPVLAVLGANAFNSLDPLRNLIHEEVFRNGMVGKIAEEESKGRKLLVGVVDLDSGELLAADLTAIARDGPQADGKLTKAEMETCFTELLVASAAVPVAFDPVATLGGTPLTPRLLVDGGVRASTFIESAERVTAMLATSRAQLGLSFDGETVVVVNGSLEICQQDTKGGMLSIGGRSIGALINQNVRNSLANILARRAGDQQCTRYTHVGPLEDLCEAEVDSTTFDPHFMNKLADRGRDRWKTGSPFESVGDC
jgi:predicted acylesterase/phospholipase RssA